MMGNASRWLIGSFSKTQKRIKNNKPTIDQKVNKYKDTLQIRDLNGEIIEIPYESGYIRKLPFKDTIIYSKGIPTSEPTIYNY